SCLEEAAAGEATQLYEQGLEAYKKNELSTALENFKKAAKFQPEHKLAVPFIELIQNQLRLTAEKSVLDWRAAFHAREFASAVAIYRRLQTGNIEESFSEAIEKIRAGYRQQLSPLIQSAKRACSESDAPTMETAQRQVDEVVPDRTVRQELGA